MEKDEFSFIAGGIAGGGIKKVGSVACYIFNRLGRRVFEMEDYQSLIQGGHNFVVVSSSVDPIMSHYLRADVVIATDRRSYEVHKEHVKEGGIIVYNADDTQGEDLKGIGIPFKSIARKYPNPELKLGVGAITMLALVMGMSKEELSEVIKTQYRDTENNIHYAFEIYDIASTLIPHRITLKHGERSYPIISGNEAIVLGAVAGGLDIYFAYPMTPSSSILHFLASHSEDFGVTVMHPENEIAVINMALGASSMGLKAMVGSSGGGMALMEEALSLSGMAEIPILAVLSSRPGPSTGVPTYTEQGDLRFALNQGHGEFPKVTASPGSIEEAFYLTSEMLSLVYEFQIPGILLTEKHLSESHMSVELSLEKSKWAEPLIDESEDYLRYRITDTGISPMRFPPSDRVVKFSSYEHDEYGLSTELPQLISQMHEKRARKEKTLIHKLKGMKTVNVYGEGDITIFTYGSTTMSVIEALKYGDLRAKVVQPIYLEPFPSWAIEEFKGEKIIVVEQSVMGTFERVLKEKAGITAHKSIRKYNGRPFDPEELSMHIKEA